MFNLIGFPDPVLDETLAEDHDKNMFDEHLGLKKEMDESSQSCQLGSAAGDDKSNLSGNNKGADSKPAVSGSSVETAAVSSSTISSMVGSPATSKTDRPKSCPSVPPPTSQPQMAPKDTAKVSKQDLPAHASPKMPSVPHSTAMLPQAVAHGSPSQHQLMMSSSSMQPVGSPHSAAAARPLVPGSPHPGVAGHPLAPGSPHPGVAGHPLAPGSPHPGAAAHPLMPGSPHPGAAGHPLVPGSPHPGAASHPLVPGSPHPGVAAYPLVPGSPHPSSSIAAGSPLSGSGTHIPPVSPHGSLVSGSPHHPMATQSPGTADTCRLLSLLP